MEQKPAESPIKWTCNRPQRIVFFVAFHNGAYTETKWRPQNILDSYFISHWILMRWENVTLKKKTQNKTVNYLPGWQIDSTFGWFFRE